MSAAPLEVRSATEADDGHRCAICQTGLAPGEPVGPCPACGAPFHLECWNENGGCAVYGCAHAPASTASLVAPSSVWGQEDRDCPRCGGRIKMAARRCVHCQGEVAPHLGDAAERAGPAGGAVMLLLAAGLFPLTAPLVLLGGGAWLLTRRRALRRWPTTTRVVAIAAVVAAAAVTFVTAIGLAVHGLTTVGEG